MDIDYRSVGVEEDDIFLFTTDGINGHITDHRMQELLTENGNNLRACTSSLLECNPLMFWKLLSGLLAAACVFLLFILANK